MVLERRYGVVNPDRERAGNRRYSEADIERLRLLRDGIETGHRIGVMADFSDE